MLLRGKENSRLLAFDYNDSSIAWEEIISDNFASSGEPIIINNIVYLVLVRLSMIKN